MRCKDIMKSQFQLASPGTTVAAAARLMADGGFGLLPVCDDQGRPLGTVTDRDIVTRVCARNLSVQTTTLDECLSSPPLTCRPDDDVRRVEELMILHKKWRILVVDERGVLVGLVSVTDIAQCEEPLRAARLFRELTSRQFRFERSSSSQIPIHKASGS